MNFVSNSQLYYFLKEPKIKLLGSGTQGQCYHDRSNNKVYKIFNVFFDVEDKIDYNSDDILKFSKVLNNTYIWASDVIAVNNEVIGYVTPYINGINLCRINPLNIDMIKLFHNLENVYKDNITISQNGIVAYDVMYNILYGKKGINIIDTDEYNFNYFGRSYEEILKINNRNINYAFKVFLVDNYFDEFIDQFNELREMYNDLDLESTIFILELQRKLSEYLESEIVCLRDALQFRNKKKVREKDLKIRRLFSSF